MKYISSIVQAVGIIVAASAAMGLMPTSEHTLQSVNTRKASTSDVALSAASNAPEAQQGAALGGACCLSGSPCVGDLNNSGAVDVQDLLILLGAWGPNPGHPADLNGSGAVDVQDLLILLGAWGPCPAGDGCQQLLETDCEAAGGVFLGEDIPCGNVYCSPVPMALEFRQLDFVNDEANIQFSNWCSLLLTYESGPDMQFLNVAIESGANAPNPAWQVQNMPLPSSAVAGTMETVVFNFDIGSAPGQRVTSLNFGASITPALVGEPVRDRNSIVTSFAITIERGEPGEPFVLDPAVPLIFPPDGALLDGEDGQVTRHRNENFPNQPCGKDECVPAAVSNSMQFLNAKHGLNMPPEKISIAKMKDATGWGPGGAPSGWWNIKDQYMKDNGYQIATTTSNDIQDVITALDNNHDVEIGGRPGHRAAITGVTRIKGNNAGWVIHVTHDVKQDGTAGRDKQVTEIGILWADGRIEGITWMRSLINFVIEKPTTTPKTAKQIAKTLEWAKIHLEAAVALLDQLIVLTNTPGADPAEIAQKQTDALNRLASALKLINKAKLHIQTMIDNGGCPDCPPVPVLEAMIPLLDGIAAKVQQAISSLATVIVSPSLPPDVKKALYASARNAANSAASQLQPIIDQLLNPSQSAIIPAGVDCWDVPCDGLSHFHVQIPPDFFGPGSDPFLIPPPSLGWNAINQAPLVIHRVMDVEFDGPLPAAATVPIQIDQLNLVSCQPIVVTYNGGTNPQPWAVQIHAMPGISQGFMTLVKETPDGGFFESFFDVFLLVQFTNLQDPSDIREMDLPPISLHASGAPWQHLDPTGGLLCGDNFAPGFAEGQPVSVIHTNPPPFPSGHHVLSIRPWMPKPNPDDFLH